MTTPKKKSAERYKVSRPIISDDPEYSKSFITAVLAVMQYLLVSLGPDQSYDWKDYLDNGSTHFGAVEQFPNVICFLKIRNCCGFIYAAI